ncbi:MAG: carboxypeptidase regulatory-like domain-containing protein, partial [Bacteroidales bacterium]
MKPETLKLLFITVLFSSSVCAQVTTGDLQGIVTDTTGKPIVLTEIIISGPSLMGNIGATSNENGYFKIKAIPPGTYSLEIKHLSYKTLIIENVNILLGRTTDMGQISLPPGKVELEEVVINWAKPALDPSSTTLGSYIDPQDLNSLPVERDYKSVLTFLPQANTSFYGDNANILGASGSDNIYYVDGMNVTDPYQASGGLIIPFNFIQGIDVKQGGYEAEFSKAMGGIINVVTPSGSNEFEASAFSYYTGDALTSKQKMDNLSARDIKDFNNYDFGLSFGGPVIKDKFWYYLAYNSIFENQDIQMQDYEPRKDKRNVHAYAAKLNWIALKNTRFMFSIIGNQSIHNQVGHAIGMIGIPTAELRNIDPVLRDLIDRGLNLALDVKKNTRSGMLFSGSMVYNNWNSKIEGQTELGRTESLYMDHV